MVRLYTCDACLRGDHENCRRGFKAPPGVIGGSRCVCPCEGDPNNLNILEGFDDIDARFVESITKHMEKEKEEIDDSLTSEQILERILLTLNSSLKDDPKTIRDLLFHETPCRKDFPFSKLGGPNNNEALVSPLGFFNKIVANLTGQRIAAEASVVNGNIERINRFVVYRPE